MDGGRLRGLHNDTVVELVNPGDGTLVSELRYTFDLAAYADIVRQLTEAYGKQLSCKALKLDEAAKAKAEKRGL
jgi:hypothetical protein